MHGWLFASGDCTWKHDFARRERMSFARGATRAFMEEVPVFPGIWFYRAGSDGRSRFRITVDDVPRESRIVLGAALGGLGTVTMAGCDEQDWREDGRFLALTPVGRRVDYDIRAQRVWQMVAVRLEENALDMLGADDAMPATVRQALEGQREDLAAMAPLSAPVRTLARSLLHPLYTGAMGRLYRQGKVLELLAHQFDILGDTGRDAQALAGHEQRRVCEARERLVADLRDPPDLNALAAMVGLTPRRLNRGFRQIFGTTVFGYLRDARLDAARDALEAGSTLPLKQLAWDLGYNQASNFVTAFRRRFDVPPGAYRRVRESEE